MVFYRGPGREARVDRAFVRGVAYIPNAKEARMPRAARTLALALALAGGSTAGAKTVVVHSGESIQDAIDAAPAGATIRVEPGTYHEAGATPAVPGTKAGTPLAGAARQGRPRARGQ